MTERRGDEWKIAPIREDDAIEARVNRVFDRWSRGDLPNERLREAVVLAVRRGRAWERTGAEVRVREELDRLLVDAHAVPEAERVTWARRLARAVSRG